MAKSSLDVVCHCGHANLWHYVEPPCKCAHCDDCTGFAAPATDFIEAVRLEQPTPTVKREWLPPGTRCYVCDKGAVDRSPSGAPMCKRCLDTVTEEIAERDAAEETTRKQFQALLLDCSA